MVWVLAESREMCAEGGREYESWRVTTGTENQEEHVNWMSEGWHEFSGSYWIRYTRSGRWEAFMASPIPPLPENKDVNTNYVYSGKDSNSLLIIIIQDSYANISLLWVAVQFLYVVLFYLPSKQVAPYWNIRWLERWQGVSSWENTKFFVINLEEIR